MALRPRQGDLENGVTQFRCSAIQMLRVIAVLSMLTYPTSGGMAKLDVSIDLGLAKIIAELRAWWEAAVTHGNVAAGEATRTSAQRLAIGFVRMAGLMETFAGRLDNASAWTDRRAADFEAHILQNLLASMHDTLSSIDAAIDGIDIHWAVSNLSIYDKSNTLLRYRTSEVLGADSWVRHMVEPRLRIVSEPTTEFRETGAALPVIFDAAEAKALADRLRELAAQGRSLANTIAETLKATENSGRD